MMNWSSSMAQQRVWRTDQRSNAMICHGPSCLTGPVTQCRDWWTTPMDVGTITSLPRSVPDQISMENQDHQRPAADAPIRADLVERVRREIAEGAYDTPEKWEIALERLLRRLEDNG